MKVVSMKYTPKKGECHHTDLLPITVYCITQMEDLTPGQVANRIYREGWLAPDSSDIKPIKLKRDIEALWPKAKNEIGSKGVESKMEKFTEPDKIEAAIQYVSENVIYDSFKQTYINKETKEESSPEDCYINYNYKIDARLCVQKQFFDIAFNSSKIPRINPLKEWDKTLPQHNKRHDYIKEICKFIPAENPRQLELFLKSWLIRAYIQAVNPYNKPETDIVNRHFLIIQSTLEGTGKSTLLNWLCPNTAWRKVSGVEESKDGKRALASYMVIIDDEMAGVTNWKQIDSFKSLISMSKVDVRLPYARKDSNLPRTASFCGSCNKTGIFSVGEENSRFLVVPLQNKMFDYEGYEKKFKNTPEKLWAQAKYLSTTNWLKTNEPEIKQLKEIVNAEFERETLEADLIDTHIREPTQEEIKTHNCTMVLRTTDILALLTSVSPSAQRQHLFTSTLGAILTKKYGQRINGYIVQNINGPTHIDPIEYKSTGMRRKGYPVVFVQKGINSESHSVVEKSLKGSRKNKKQKPKKIQNAKKRV